jgi:hypothetical protein
MEQRSGLRPCRVAFRVYDSLPIASAKINLKMPKTTDILKLPQWRLSFFTGFNL